MDRHSLSSSDCASLYSHEEATLLDSHTRDPASAPGSVPQLSLRPCCEVRVWPSRKKKREREEAES